MSEFVLNDAAVAGDFVDIEEAAGVVASVGTGMASLIDGASVRKVLRLHSKRGVRTAVYAAWAVG